MKSWVLAGALVTAVFAQPAWAADFGDGPTPPRRDTYDYRYDYRYGEKSAPPPSYRFEDDDDGRYDDPRHAPRRFSGPAAPPSAYGRTCARSEEVRERLTTFGWRDFHGGQPQGETVLLRARRPNGRLFELTLDRCSGQIVEAQPLEPRRFGAFAWRERGWYDRPYGYGPRGWYRD
jgi:hypothetical protein